MAPNIRRKTHEDLFLVVTPNKGLYEPCGRIVCRRKSHKNLFGHAWEIRAKILPPRRICFLLHLCSKGTVKVAVIKLNLNQARIGQLKSQVGNEHSCFDSTFRPNKTFSSAVFGRQTFTGFTCAVLHQ